MGKPLLGSYRLDGLKTSQVNAACSNPMLTADVFQSICREYSGQEDTSYFAFPLPFDHASAASPESASFQSDDQAQEAPQGSAMLPVNSSCETIAAAPVADIVDDDSTIATAPAPATAAAPAPGSLPVPLPGPLLGPLLPAPTAAPAPATAAAPAAPAATVGTPDDVCITATANVVSASGKASTPEHPQIKDTPADTTICGDSASSQSAESVCAPRSHASGDGSGTSHSSSGDVANSPDSHSSSGDVANSPDSCSSACNAINSRSSNTSTRAAESRQRAQSIHTPGVGDRASHNLPLGTNKEQRGPVCHTAHCSQAMPARNHAHLHAHTHAQTQEQQVPIKNSDAQPDAMSSHHPKGASESGPYHYISDGNPAENRACLSAAVSRALQEFMLSHESANFMNSLQVCSLSCW